MQYHQNSPNLMNVAPPPPKKTLKEENKFITKGSCPGNSCKTQPNLLEVISQDSKTTEKTIDVSKLSEEC